MILIVVVVAAVVCCSLFVVCCLLLVVCCLLFVVPSRPLSARTGDMVKLLVRACLCSFRSLEAVFRDGTLKLCPLVRSCAR